MEFFRIGFYLSKYFQICKETVLLKGLIKGFCCRGTWMRCLKLLEISKWTLTGS